MALEQAFTLRIEQIVTHNAAMARCLKLAALAAKAEVPVLILGETGTGKTLLAQAIHNSSRRAKGPFVSFNASAMSDTLLESELFGHERGAFTGAFKAVKGKFELADMGTLFLDEIADMSSLAQAKILRAVEYGQFERVGAERSSSSNVRIATATNCSLRERIRVGRFREDLYHRLGGLTLLIPPLRDRTEDLPALISAELSAAAQTLDKTISSIHREAFDKLLSHTWPGNLRELHHTMPRAALLCDVISAGQRGCWAFPGPPSSGT
jgi:transcriptional regulator with GAF, ATPase, and Fis domain